MVLTWLYVFGFLRPSQSFQTVEFLSTRTDQILVRERERYQGGLPEKLVRLFLYGCSRAVRLR